MTMIDELRAKGISLAAFHPGKTKCKCPRCNADTLEIEINKQRELASWSCGHCFWQGQAGDVSTGNHESMEEAHQLGTRKLSITDKQPEEETDIVDLEGMDLIRAYLESKGISDKVRDRNHVMCPTGETDVMSFIYRSADSKYFNVKFESIGSGRVTFKNDVPLCFYGEYSLGKCPDIIITENELDKLTLDEAGFPNVMATPNGAPGRIEGRVDLNKHFSYLQRSEAVIKNAKKIYIAVHNDAAGAILQQELIRRIGPEKCWIVNWGKFTTANSALQGLGKDVFSGFISDATPIPITGLYAVDDFQDSLKKYFTGGMAAGVPTGFSNLDKLYSVMPGELTVVTGIPNSGKSEFVDALITNIAKGEDWRFAIFSPENSKEQHVAKLVEKVVGLPVSPKHHERMSLEQFMNGAAWVNKYFYFLIADDVAALPTIDWVLEKAHAAVYRYGVKGLVIDPWNEIESTRPAHMQETEWVGTCLAKIKRWARAHAVKVWIVAHPTKITADKDGKTRAPSLYDIAGSANWVNKPDNGIVIYRSEDAADTTIAYVKKVRFKHVGHRGQCSLNYDKSTGRYSVPPNHPDVNPNEPDSITYAPPPSESW